MWQNEYWIEPRDRHARQDAHKIQNQMLCFMNEDDSEDDADERAPVGRNKDENNDYDTEVELTEEDEPDDSLLQPNESAQLYTEDSEKDNTPAQDASILLELLFALSLSLYEERPLDDDPGTLTVVFFSGILGYSDTLQSFLPARSFTSYLSVLIYHQRLLFLESLLPLQPYPSLGIKKRPRTGQIDLLNKVRRRFMVAGAQSSFDELFSLRNYGRVIAR